MTIKMFQTKYLYARVGLQAFGQNKILSGRRGKQPLKIAVEPPGGTPAALIKHILFNYWDRSSGRFLFAEWQQLDGPHVFRPSSLSSSSAAGFAEDNCGASQVGRVG